MNDSIRKERKSYRMKGKQMLLFLAAMLFCCCSDESELKAEVKTDVKAEAAANIGKTLVVYYSYTGNCREIVNTLTSRIEADVLEIQHHYRHATLVEPDGCHHADLPVPKRFANGRETCRTDCLEPFERHQRCG